MEKVSWDWKTAFSFAIMLGILLTWKKSQEFKEG